MRLADAGCSTPDLVSVPKPFAMKKWTLSTAVSFTFIVATAQQKNTSNNSEKSQISTRQRRCRMSNHNRKMNFFPSWAFSNRIPIGN
jgi:hypothetical protein